jgi:hypothetical protein
MVSLAEYQVGLLLETDPESAWCYSRLRDVGRLDEKKSKEAIEQHVALGYLSADDMRVRLRNYIKWWEDLPEGSGVR